MNAMSRTQLESLVRLEGSPCVSIFLPLSGGGPRTAHEDHVRYRNLLRAAGRELMERGWSREAADDLLAPAAALAAEKAPWDGPAGGLAVHLAPGFLRPSRVELALPERCEVGERFVVRPLLPLLDRVERFYVLAASLASLRVVEATAAGARALELAGVPKSFREAMGELAYHSEVSAHTATPGALGRRAAIFHGHGDDDEEHFKDDVFGYFRRALEAIERVLPEPAAPVVLAAVERHLPALRQAGRRLRFLDDALVGNPELASDAELAARGRELVDGEVARRIDRELVRWVDARDSGRTELDLERIVLAADQGRVDTLFVGAEAERWGSFERDLGRVAVHEAREPGDVDLLDLAASRALATGGDVHQLPLGTLPEGRAALALLRWPA
jgi:hypothetical protein